TSRVRPSRAGDGRGASRHDARSLPLLGVDRLRGIAAAGRGAADTRLPACLPVPRSVVAVRSLRAYHPAMSKREPKPTDPASEESSRFDRVMTALFRVDKREIPKHEPKRRQSRLCADDDAKKGTLPL